MKVLCDMHLHSYCSDGALSPAEVIKLCADANLTIASLTDHDNAIGVEEAVSAAEKLNIKCIPGIEFSTFASLEVHILGYNIPYKDSCFIDEINKILDLRRHRNEEIIRKLKAQGVKLKVGDLFESGVKGRQHISQLLLEQGYVRSRAEAFDKYIGANKPCFVKAYRISTEDAIRLITDYGGVPVIAHPMRYAARVNLIEFIDNLTKIGLKGIELYYPNTYDENIKLLTNIAIKNDLILTGGSDFHSAEYGAPIGSVNAFLDEKALKVLKLL